MEIVIKAYLFKSPNEIGEFAVKVNEHNKIMITKKLKSEYSKIVNYLKELKKRGEIKTYCWPKNKKIQDKLDKIIKVKKEIKKSLEKIKTII